MAEKVVVTQHLSDEMVKAGAKLLEEFDRSHLPVQGLFWMYFPESEDWRLIVVMPGVKTRGPLWAYQQIQSVLSGMSQDEPFLGVEQTSVRDSTDPLITLLRKAVRIRGKGPSGVRFSRNTVDGVYLEDTYIYHLD